MFVFTNSIRIYTYYYIPTDVFVNSKHSSMCKTGHFPKSNAYIQESLTI